MPNEEKGFCESDQHEYEIKTLNKVKKISSSALEEKNPIPQNKYETLPTLLVVKICKQCGKVETTEINLEENGENN
jgi:hypothetical protein